jgi:Ca2+-binding RTX toxin-like protein
VAEPNGELGLVTSSDPQWGAQKGGPRDPQNLGHGNRDTQGGPENDVPAGTSSTNGATGGSGTGGTGGTETGGSGNTNQTLTFKNVPGTAVYGQDVTDPSKNSLFVYGTSGNDVIDIHASSTKPGYIEVTLNSKVIGTYNNVYRLYVWGDSGDDTITIQSSTGNIPAFIYGEDGNDKITAGSGYAYIDGGAGNDSILGASARSVIVGGTGADVLNGLKDEDLVIGGTLNYIEDFQAQAGILAEWTRTDLTFSQRANNLRTGVGLANGYMINSTTVLDDAVKDSVLGAQGSDWLWAASIDITDYKGNGSSPDLLN